MKRFALRFCAFSAIGLTLYCYPYVPGGTFDAWFDTSWRQFLGWASWLQAREATVSHAAE